VASVETVRGPVDSAELGVTLMHEHVFVLSFEAQDNYPELAHWDEEVRVADAVEKLQAAAAVGVRTVVDPTVLGLGRYIPRIQRIAAAVPEINIVAATGAYSYHDVPFFFYFRGPGRELDMPEPMTEIFVHDITEGIADTGVKAAFLKVATEEPEIAPGVERILRAVAGAHRRTGVPITTHSNPRHRNGLLQQKVLRQEGVDLTRVVIGHSGDTTDADYLKEVMDAGSFIGMDRFGIDLTPESAGERVDIVARLCKDGYAGQMVLSHDAACHNDWLGTPEEVAAVLPNWNYTHIHRDVIPALREKGVDDKQLQQMLVENPRRYFEAVGAY
jgi:phosphotriesterase-related protein